MITLLIDGATAVVKTLDRLLTAVDGARRPVSPLTVDDARPAGVAETSPGGHPIRSTSELLFNAVSELNYAYPGPKHAVIKQFQEELADRAAELAAVGD